MWMKGALICMPLAPHVGAPYKVQKTLEIVFHSACVQENEGDKDAALNKPNLLPCTGHPFYGHQLPLSF